MSSLKPAILQLSFACAAIIAVTPAIAFGGERVAEVKAAYPSCGRAASESDIQGAKAADSAAIQAYAKSEFSRAARLWTEAYGFDCSRPRVFLNIANAYEKAGDKQGALAVLELFVERAPPEEVDDALRARIDGLRADVKIEDDAAVALAKQNAPPPALEPTKPEDLETARPFGVAPWVTLAVGGATAVAGGVLLGVGLSQASSAADDCADPEARTGCPQEAIDDGEAGETMSQVGQGLLYGGAGVVALSLVWQFALNGEEPVIVSGAHIELVPAFGPGVAAVSLSGRF